MSARSKRKLQFTLCYFEKYSKFSQLWIFHKNNLFSVTSWKNFCGTYFVENSQSIFFYLKIQIGTDHSIGIVSFEVILLSKKDVVPKISKFIIIMKKQIQNN